MCLRFCPRDRNRTEIAAKMTMPLLNRLNRRSGESKEYSNQTDDGSDHQSDKRSGMRKLKLIPVAMTIAVAIMTARCSSQRLYYNLWPGLCIAQETIGPTSSCQNSPANSNEPVRLPLSAIL